MPQYRYIKNPSVKPSDPVADHRLYTHNSLDDRLEAVRVDVSDLILYKNPNENFSRTLDPRPISDCKPTLVVRIDGVMKPHPELAEPDWPYLVPSYHHMRTKGLIPMQQTGVCSYVTAKKEDDPQ